MKKANQYPTDTSEYLIHTKLDELINLCKEKIYTAEFKRTEEFKTDRNDLETLGMIVSKYCEWDGYNIKVVAEAALEDANFDGIEIIFYA